MLTPSPTRRIPMHCTERQAHISDCGRLMQAAMARYAESSDLADMGDAHRWRRLMEA